MDLKEIRAVNQEVIVGCRCDQCGKESATYDNWVVSSHGHSEWGNDSIDSYETFDLCSPQCYLYQLAASVEHMSGYSSAQVDDLPIDFIRGLLAYIDNLVAEARAEGYQSRANESCDYE